MTVLTLSEAAAATGLNKTTVLRSIKSGKISGTRDPLGQWRIDVAALHRVYPLVADATATKTHNEVLNSLMRMARQRLSIRTNANPPDFQRSAQETDNRSYSTLPIAGFRLSSGTHNRDERVYGQPRPLHRRRVGAAPSLTKDLASWSEC